MSDEDRTAGLLADQAAYYRARAPEYDEWWQRVGRYDHGPEALARWQAELTTVRQALDRPDVGGTVLELACGTGWWTAWLAARAARLTCVDASAEVIALNRGRLEAAGLPLPRYVEADLFAWRPGETFDAVFLGFWLSHVPTVRFDAFWASVAAALKPGGRAFLVDSLPGEANLGSGHRMPDADDVQERRLNDGRTFRVVKVYYDPANLMERLRRLGWKARIAATPTYFLYGEVQRM